MNAPALRPPVRVALFGLGRAMFDDHYAFFRRHPELFSVVAACDIVKERRDLVARDYPLCKMFRQFPDMLDEFGIDLVDIATCSADHVEHAITALKRGFWTLLETPVALTYAEAQLLRGAAVKARNRLLVMQRGIFDPGFLLAQREMSDARLGEIYRISIRKADFVRRDDWQAVKRLGGGAAYYAMTDLVTQALKLMPSPPAQMWSDLKRVASVGDAEDYVRLCFKTCGLLSTELEFNGGLLAGARRPAFEIFGERGVFSAAQDATEGVVRCIDPDFQFPRRRSSVRTPQYRDMHEDVPVIEETLTLKPGERHGLDAFWRSVYDTVRTAAPFPVSLENAIEAIKFSELMKKTSLFAK